MIDMDDYVMSNMLREFHENQCFDELNLCRARDNMEVIIHKDLADLLQKLHDETSGLQKCFEDMG
jgi:hypothetical protein